MQRILTLSLSVVIFTGSAMLIEKYVADKHMALIAFGWLSFTLGMIMEKLNKGNVQ